MENSIVSEKKKEIRKEIRARLKNLSDQELEKLNSEIQARLENEFSSLLDSFQNIAFYMPLKTEADIIPSIKKYMKNGKNCFLPRVVDGQNMIFHLLDNESELEIQLEKGAFNILEPKKELAVMKMPFDQELLVLVPAMAFARNSEGGFSRLGKGKGYYDRFLSACPNARTLGICFPFQLLDCLPVDSYDKSIDSLIF
ncbi:MAG: 5-formyltetrahydrofolate cyclo-ligase [Treponemataceae bacterium]|nr:5-formyltetrahydrofolate cyclo-ligase [Treponemataceae bacterium]